MKRIAVIGSSGAGKSTFSRQLGDILQLPVIHLDTLFWQPGWIETPRPEWRVLQGQLVQQEQWIIDGNYTSTMNIRLQAADTVIFLDYPRLLCLYRALKRRVQYTGKTRPDMNEGCPERIDPDHLLWIWNYPARERVNVLTTLEQYSSDGKHVVILRSPAKAKHFLLETKAAEKA